MKQLTAYWLVSLRRHPLLLPLASIALSSFGLVCSVERPPSPSLWSRNQPELKSIQSWANTEATLDGRMEWRTLPGTERKLLQLPDQSERSLCNKNEFDSSVIGWAKVRLIYNLDWVQGALPAKYTPFLRWWALHRNKISTYEDIFSRSYWAKSKEFEKWLLQSELWEPIKAEVKWICRFVSYWFLSFAGDLP